MKDDRVHPVNSHADDTDSSVRSPRPTNVDDDTESLHSSVSGMEESHLLKKQQQQQQQPPRLAVPASYVIQIPKDQIYRLPPPENAHLFDTYTRRGKRSSSGRTARCCCVSRRCLLWTMGVFALVLLALATATGVLYLVARPRLPTYAIDSISVRGFGAANLTGSSPVVLSPEFDLSVRADNRRNAKIGIDYRDGSTASVAHSSVVLADGAWPAFYQGRRNVTVVGMALRGSGVRLSNESLREQLARGLVPLEIGVRVPVRVKLGPISSWTFKVKVKCDVVVDKLGSDAKVVSKSCKANAAW